MQLREHGRAARDHPPLADSLRLGRHSVRGHPLQGNDERLRQRQRLLGLVCALAVVLLELVETLFDDLVEVLVGGRVKIVHG